MDMHLRAAYDSDRMTGRKTTDFGELVEAHMRSVYRLAFELTRIETPRSRSALEEILTASTVR